MMTRSFPEEQATANQLQLLGIIKWVSTKKTPAKRNLLFFFFFLQGISYSDELKLGFMTVQRANESTIAWPNCFTRATLRADGHRLPPIPNESVVSDVLLLLHPSDWKPPACRAHVIQQNTRRQMDFWTNFLSIYMMWETVHRMMTACRRTHRSSLVCVYTIVWFLCTLRWFCRFLCLKITRQSFWVCDAGEDD